MVSEVATPVASKTVLIIDDDLVIKTMLEDILQDNDYTTVHAMSGSDGLRVLEEVKPDIILLDIEMPGMSGIDVCQKIRKLPLNNRPSIIMVSGTSDTNTIVNTFRQGADDFIVKPFNELELIARIEAQSKLRKFYRSLEEKNRELELIRDITKTVSKSLDSGEILYSVVKKTAEFIHATRCSIVLIGENDEAYIVASHESPTIRDLKIDLKKYPELKKALLTREPLVIEDMGSDPILADVKDLIQNIAHESLLVIPIIWEEDMLGTLILRTRRTDKSFTADERNLCQIIANSAYHPLRKAKIFEDLTAEKEHLKKLAITDQLTGLYNHDFFYNRLDDEFNRAVRYDVPLSLIMIDLDNFKMVNDTYGHPVGDKVLRSVAGLLRKTVRKTDSVARYGGEEFSVILPHTSLEGARDEAERIREVVASHSYVGLIDTVISISAGVASYPNETILSSGDLVNLADNALYEAKNSGKNRVVAKSKFR